MCLCGRYSSFSPPPILSGVRYPHGNIHLLNTTKIMEKSITTEFMDLVIAKLKEELSNRRKEDEKTESAMLKFNVIGVLKDLGATDVTATLDIQNGKKDSLPYAWLRVEACKDNFYHRIPDFSQRRQATKAEVETAKEIVGAPVVEAVCVAGIHQVNPENLPDISMKWETLSVVNEDGEVEGFKYSGAVRKYHADTNSYDAPVAAE